MNVRPATPADAAGIGAVQSRTSWATYTDHIDPEVLARVIPEREEAWVEKLAAGLPTAVAEQDGEIVGFASWGPSTWAHHDGDGDGELIHIFVVPEAQNAGVGTALHAVVLDGLRALGFSSAFLWVLSSNAQARAFYEHAGWSEEPDTETIGTWGRPRLRYRRAL